MRIHFSPLEDMFLIASCGRDCKGFAPGLPKFEHPALLFRPPSNVPISLCWNENLMTKLAPLLAALQWYASPALRNTRREPTGVMRATGSLRFHTPGGADSVPPGERPGVS